MFSWTKSIMQKITMGMIFLIPVVMIKTPNTESVKSCDSAAMCAALYLTRAPTGVWANFAPTGRGG